MTTPIFVTGFEHGVASTSGGGLFSAVYGATIQSTDKRTGTYALRAYTNAGAVYVERPVSTPTVLVEVLYILFKTSLPSADCHLAMFHGSNTASSLILGFQQSSSKLTLQFGAAGTPVVASSVVTTGTWYRIDIKGNVAANPNLGDWQIDGTAQPQLSVAQAASSFDTFRLGTSAAFTGEIIYDDLVLSATSADYPIGAEQVAGLSPDGAGTSNPGTIIQDNGSVTVNDNSNPANVELDNVPLNSTADFIKQTGTGASNYAEVAFADLSGASSVLGAMAILAYHAAGTQANAAQTRIRDGAGQETAVYSGDMSESSLFYKSVIITPPVAGWSQTTVNALLARVGYASDANPNPYWDALMIEVAYTVASGTSNPISLAGSIATAGALTNQDKKTLAGAVAAAGALTRQVQKTLAGTAASAGALASQIKKTLAGAIASAGSLVYGKGSARTFTGGIAPVGALARQDQKTLSGAIAPAGLLIKQFARSLVGGIASSGALTYTRAVLRTFTGGITPTGGLGSQIKKTLSGAVASAGTLARQPRKTLAGSMASSGALTTIKAILRTFAGGIGPTGTLASQVKKTMSGTVSSAGALISQFKKTFTGTVTSGGALIKGLAFVRTFTGGIAPAGGLTNQVRLAFAGVIASAGTLAKRIGKTLAGVIASVGSYLGVYQQNAPVTQWVPLTLKARSRSLLLESRLTQLSLSGRGLSLEERNQALTLASRSVRLTLEEL